MGYRLPVAQRNVGCAAMLSSIAAVQECDAREGEQNYKCWKQKH